MVEFIEESHTYVNSKGIIIPSVSDLVAHAFPGTYANIPEEVLRKAADYGTKVHQILEEYDLGNKDRAYELAINGGNNMLNALGDYAQLKKKWIIYPKKQEEIVDYQERYAGRYDKLDEQNILWDVKTNSEMYADKWALQLGLYYLALGIEKDIAYVIWLPKRKKARVIEINVLNHKECLKVLEDYEECNSDK